MSKATDNTDLLRALGLTKAERKFYERIWEEDFTARTRSVSSALMKHSPLKARDWFSGAGYGRFRVEADGRGYTVLTLANDPAAWHWADAKKVAMDHFTFYANLPKVETFPELFH